MTTRTYAEVKAEFEATRRAAVNYDNLQNEGGEGYNPYFGKLDALFMEMEAAEWTVETTTTRRAEWNALVRSGALTDKRTGKIDNAKLTSAYKAQGWTAQDLKKHVERHGL